MKNIKIRLTFTEECLGTANPDAKIHEDYIASKAPDAKSKEEEVAAIGVEAAIENGKTVFSKDNGHVFLWDYQIRGFFKEACGNLQRCKGEEFSKNSCKIKAYKKVIDGCIFVNPRKIKIDTQGSPLGDCQRPLRGATAQGERIALANSETVPAGSVIEFCIESLSDAYAPAIMEWLDYGRYKGIGQWRNSGKGRFIYEVLPEDYEIV